MQYTSVITYLIDSLAINTNPYLHKRVLTCCVKFLMGNLYYNKAVEYLEQFSLNRKFSRAIKLMPANLVKYTLNEFRYGKNLSYNDWLWWYKVERCDYLEFTTLFDKLQPLIVGKYKRYKNVITLSYKFSTLYDFISEICIYSLKTYHCYVFGIKSEEDMLKILNTAICNKVRREVSKAILNKEPVSYVEQEQIPDQQRTSQQ